MMPHFANKDRTRAVLAPDYHVIDGDPLESHETGKALLKALADHEPLVDRMNRARMEAEDAQIAEPEPRKASRIAWWALAVLLALSIALAVLE